MKLTRVVCGLLVRRGRALVHLRPAGKPYPCRLEFPGGKVAPGEGDVTALVREWKEELDVWAQVDSAQLPPATYRGRTDDAGEVEVVLLRVNSVDTEAVSKEGGAVFMWDLDDLVLALATSPESFLPSMPSLVAQCLKKGW